MALEHPIYVLVGSEPVQRGYLLKRLRDQSGSWEKVSAKELDPSEVTQASLLADPDRPMIRVIEDYEAWKPKQRKEMGALASQLGQGLNVVICASRLGPKDPIREAVDEQAIVKLSSPRPGAYPEWLCRQARLMGVPISGDTAELLVDRLGEDTQSLCSEIERLSPMGEVNRELVDRFTPALAHSQAWGWVDAVVGGQTADSLLSDCEASGLEPLMILGALSKRFCLLTWVKLADQQSSGTKDYPWRLAQRAAKGWSDPALRDALSSIGKAEEEMKGKSQLEGYTQLARLSHQLAYSAASSNT